MSSYGTIVASHQPHFFPWLGYFDKMAKSDLFLINDVAQLEKQSPMTRNTIIDRTGNKRYINVSISKDGYTKKQNREILICDWEKKRLSLKGIIRDCYLHADYYKEIWPLVNSLLDKKFQKLIDLNMETIKLGRNCLAIDTPIVFQSTLSYKNGNTTSEKLSEKLHAINASTYLSGNGGKKYMNLNDFNEKGIEVIFQSFSYPLYPQNTINSIFISNLSFLDLIFNCGIDKSRKIFWDNVINSDELHC